MRYRREIDLHYAADSLSRKNEFSLEYLIVHLCELQGNRVLAVEKNTRGGCEK